MISANELRIGNLVQSDIMGNGDIEIMKVERVSKGSIRCEIPFGSFQEVEGVKLTAKIIYNSGFEEIAENKFRINIGKGLNTLKPSRMIIKFTANNNWVVIQPANRTIYLRFVHQLQNLYFALTGKELEINL